MNKSILAIGCSLAAIMSVGAQAYADSSCEPACKPVCKPCKPPFCRSPCQCNCPPCEPRDYCCDPFQIGDEELPCKCCPAAYNAAAAIEVDGWDVFVEGSFIYWRADQDHMDVAKSAVFVPAAGGVDAFLFPANDTTVSFVKNQYKPGFKVGLGFESSCDGWVFAIDYTRLHQQLHTSKAAPVADADDFASGNVWVPTDYFTTLSDVNDPDAPLEAATSVSSKWRLHFDMLDLNASRPYYQGRAVTVTPYGGLRAMWIRQNLTIDFDSLLVPGTVFSSHNSSKNWAIGANAGLITHWLIGAGFRFEGMAGASALYTQFKASHSEINTINGAAGKFSKYKTVRPMAEAGLGMGWGAYVGDSSMHLDISARYDFMVLWGQNVMRHFDGMLNSSAYASPVGDLHMQGLTLTARFDF